MVAHEFLALRWALFAWRTTHWTLAKVRRRIHHLLLRRIGHYLLCLQHINSRVPRGPPRM
jgi:hypothetical protein